MSVRALILREYPPINGIFIDKKHVSTTGAAEAYNRAL